MLLEIRRLSKYFGGIRAIDEVSFSLKQGTITSIIGPNGAGKTTLFNCMTGFMRPTKGSIIFMNTDISHHPPDRICRLGISRTFQNIRLFKSMSVMENVMVGRHSRLTSGLSGIVSRSRSFNTEEDGVRRAAYEYLEFLGLESYAGHTAGSLPYGAQRRLEIARAMATEPLLILLDEPTAGMNPSETEAMMEIIRKIRSVGKTIILIEHDMNFVMGISDRIIVLDHGVRIAEGRPQDVRNDPMVIEAYLGKETC